MDTSLRVFVPDALTLFQACITAADPYQTVKNCLAMNRSNLEIALDLNDASKKCSERVLMLVSGGDSALISLPGREHST